MTYNPNIPQPSDNLSVSQGDLLTNFQTANTSFGKNHFPFDDLPVNNGKHKFSQYPAQGGAPATLTNEGALYTKTGTFGNELFYIRDNNVATEVALTSSKIPAPLAATQGYTFIAGDMIIQWGKVLTTAASSTQSFNVAFKNACFQVITTPVYVAPNAAAGYAIGDAPPPSTTGFFWFARLGVSGGSPQGFYWWAIGN